MTLDSIIEFRENTAQLESPIGGIPVRTGYKCLKCGCCVRKWDSMMAHFRRKHKGENAKEWSEDDVDMQLVFGGCLKRWFPVRDRSMVEVDEGNESAWLAAEVLLAKRRRWVTRQLKEREENVRLLNGFMVRTRWDILIEGHDKKRLITLAALAKEKDPLHRIMELSQKYFESISDKLRVGDVLLRRKIESEGYAIILYYINDRSDLENMPFKPSEQKSTLAGNARMFARLLCSVLRMIQQKHCMCGFHQNQLDESVGEWGIGGFRG
jgi:hypothetical protein